MWCVEACWGQGVGDRRASLGPDPDQVQGSRGWDRVTPPVTLPFATDWEGAKSVNKKSWRRGRAGGGAP